MRHSVIRTLDSELEEDWFEGTITKVGILARELKALEPMLEFGKKYRITIEEVKDED